MPPKSKASQKPQAQAAAHNVASTLAGGAETSDATRHLLVDDHAVPSGTPDKQADGHDQHGHAGSDWSAKTLNRNLAYPLPHGISPEAINNTESLLRFVILGLISGAAVASRLFAVIRFESVIHEL
jgi:dolichyl-diphosphooligosaccharide--protein glycosyltransferase